MGAPRGSLRSRSDAAAAAAGGGEQRRGPASVRSAGPHADRVVYRPGPNPADEGRAAGADRRDLQHDDPRYWRRIPAARPDGAGRQGAVADGVLVPGMAAVEESGD